MTIIEKDFPMTGPVSSLRYWPIIPDSETLALTLEQANSRGLSVVTAQDPQAALMMADMALPDIVITDLFPTGTPIDLGPGNHNRFPIRPSLCQPGRPMGKPSSKRCGRAGQNICRNQPAPMPWPGVDRAIQHVPHALEEIPGIEELTTV